MTKPPGTRRAARSRPRPVEVDRVAADQLPIARVAVDTSLAHLDRPFDYLVSAAESAAAQPGVRVRVRFAGRLVDGYILERAETSEHVGKLSFIARVVSDEIVLTKAVAALCRAVADRYAGTMPDVIRLAVPPRHARTEQEPATPGPDPAELAEHAAPKQDAAGWACYPDGNSLLDAVAAGRAARAVWQALPGEDWAARFAEVAHAVWSTGRGVLLLVPDARDLRQVERAMAAILPEGAFETLSADRGPAERYRRFLRVSRGDCRVVAGTRGAAFAPVTNLGLVALFDDGDDLYAEPRAPYPHAREVATIRASQQGAALLLGGFARTAEGQLLVESGWSRSVAAARTTVRAQAPRIEAGGDDYAVGFDSAAARARLTPAAFAAAREALAANAPVLIQVPRSGYQPSLACAECGRAARCRRCSGPLAIPRGARTPMCRWCGVAVPRWVCPACASHRLRATVTGAVRTAEEIGRAFPGVRLRTSMGGKVLDRIEAEPAIVVATPGAEPIADGKYGAALLLDGSLMLGRPDLRAGEETLRRWMAAATLVRSATDGGRVIVGADTGLAVVQALLRWDPVGFAVAELSERRALGFPPVVAMASIEGEESVVAAAADELTAPDSRMPASTTLLGPVPVISSGGEQPGTAASDDARAPAAPTAEVPKVRLLVRVASEDRKALATALRTLAASRSLHKEPGSIRIDVDPAELG